MHDKAVDNYAYVLKLVPAQGVCIKALNNYSSTILFVSECYQTQGMRDKAVDTCHIVFDYVPN